MINVTKLVLNYLKKPSTWIDLMIYVWIIMSFINEWFSIWFIVVPCLAVVRNFILKQYNKIPITIGMYLVLWSVIYLFGFIGFIVMAVIIVGPMLWKVWHNADSIWNGAMHDKDKAVLTILEKYQKEETPYMKELKQKIKQYKEEER